MSPVVAAVHALNQQVIPLAKTTTATVAAGGQVLAVDDRMGISNGTVLRVGSGASAELVTVTAVPALGGVPPDPGNVVVQPGVAQLVPSGTAVAIVGNATPVAGRQACALALPAVQGADALFVTDGNAFVAGETVRLTTAGGDVSFYRLAQNAAAVAPEMLTLQTPLARAHPQGSTLVGRDPLFDVEALDAGIWGNRLRIVVEDETPGLVSRTTLASFTNPTTIRLASAAGVQPGTILELFDTTTGATVGRSREGLEHQPRRELRDHPGGNRAQRAAAESRARCAVARVQAHGRAAAATRPGHAVTRHTGHRRRDLPQPVARSRGTATTSRRRSARSTGRCASGIAAARGRRCTSASRTAPAARTRRRSGSAPRRSSTCFPTAAGGPRAAPRTGRRRRRNRLDHGLALHR